MIPEAIPAAAVDLRLIEGGEIGDLVLDPRLHRRRSIGQRPGAKDIRGMDALRFDHQLRRHGVGLRHGGEPISARRGGAGPERQFAGAGSAGCAVPAGLIIFIGDGEPFILGIITFHAEHTAIGAHIHGTCIGRPQPERQTRLVGCGIADIDLGRVPLPEIAGRERHAAHRRADITKPKRAGPGRGVDPGMAGLRALDDGETVGAELA